jgi:hypothetical protein
MDEISADLIVELPPTQRGFKHILCIVEAFSGSVEAYPIRNKTSKEVSSCFLDYFCRFGWPRRIRVDRGGEFLGEECKELFSWGGIELKTTSTHRPTSNGQVERMNQEIKKVIAKTATDEDDWDLHLAAAVWTLNARNNRRADVSPYQILFGITPRIPTLQSPTREIQDKNDDNSWGTLLRKRADLRQASMENWRATMREYELGRRKHAWNEGDLALLRNFTRKKFDPRWRGPYLETRTGGRSVTLKTDAGREIVANVSDIKPYKQSKEKHQARAAVVESEDRHLPDAGVEDSVSET